MRQIYTKMLMAFGIIFPLSFLIPATVFAAYSITQLTDNENYHTRPTISDSGAVVWESWDGNDEDFFYDGTIITQLTDDDYYDD